MFCRAKLLTKSTHISGLLVKKLLCDSRVKLNSSILSSVFANSKINSIDDWSNLKKAILTHEWNTRGYYTDKNIDTAILLFCLNAKNYDLGTSYFNFLKRDGGKPNLATQGRYLRLLYFKNIDACLESGKSCLKKEEEQILKLYKEIQQDYPILDAITLENVILALSLTTQWRRCLDLLQEMKVSGVPSSVAYCGVISAAFINKDEDMAWKLLEEMFSNERNPVSDAFLSYFRTLKKKEKAIERLEKLFLFFQNHDFKCAQDVAEGITQLGEKLGFKSHFTTVNYNKGVCESCHQKLKSFELDDEEFNELKVKMFENVIVGKDLFVRTNPLELEKFKEFVANMGRFDVIMDGLNVAYSAGTKQSPQVFSALVASVVSHFVKQGKKVLMLGRVHMAKWPKNNWSYIMQNASVFLTQNISQDDPYFLYCALNSGKDTIIVTRDLMRSHKFLLKDTRHKMLFNRWLSQRQYHLVTVDNNNKPIFRLPPPFSVTAQKNDNTWHIPYETDTPKDKTEFHKTWLCLKF